MEPAESPAERRRHKMRERILDAAEHVFASKGAEGLSIRRLAEKIDYSPAAIYKYFGSKDELINQLKESFFALLIQRIQASLDIPMPAGQRARSCAAIYISIAAEKPHHYAAAYHGEYADIGPGEDEPGFEDSKKGQAFMMLRSMIEQGIADGTFRQSLDSSLAAKSVWASLHGLAMMITHIPTYPMLRTHTPTLSQPEFIAFHADQIVRGLEGQS